MGRVVDLRVQGEDRWRGGSDGRGSVGRLTKTGSSYDRLH